MRAGAGRSSRFLSDDSAEAYHREDGSLSFSDVFSDRATAAAPSNKMHNGNKNNGFSDVLYRVWSTFFFMFIFCVSVCSNFTFLNFIIKLYLIILYFYFSLNCLTNACLSTGTLIYCIFCVVYDF